MMRYGINPYSITKAIFEWHRSPVMIIFHALLSTLNILPANSVGNLYMFHNSCTVICYGYGNVSRWKQENINRKAQLSPIEHVERQFTCDVRWRNTVGKKNWVQIFVPVFLVTTDIHGKTLRKGAITSLHNPITLKMIRGCKIFSVSIKYQTSFTRLDRKLEPRSVNWVRGAPWCAIISLTSKSAMVEASIEGTAKASRNRVK